MSIRANDGGGSLLNIILSGMAIREREREHRPIEQACPGTSHGTRVHKEFAVVPNSLKTEMIAGVNYEETNGKEVLGYT